MNVTTREREREEESGLHLCDPHLADVGMMIVVVEAAPLFKGGARAAFPLSLPLPLRRITQQRMAGLHAAHMCCVRF